MKSIAVFSKLVSPATIAAAFLFAASISPAQAFAQNIPGSVQTGQLIPPGQNTCQAISITNINPHVYGGVLESFDVTISDATNSYVGILAQVGNTPIPLNFITRWAGVPSGLMIHVDTPNTAVNGIVPITLTLLSSPQNAPTCVTVVSFALTSGNITPVTQPVQSQPQQTHPSYPTSGTSNANPGKGSTPASAASGSHSVKPGSGTQATGSSTIASSTASASVSNSFFSNVCSGSNAYRLWFVLLIIYLIIVAIVVFAEPWFLESSVIGSTAAILVPLILLLAFWYLSASCRAASWIPVLACIIAIVGLFLAFREYELPPLLPAPSEQ